MPVDPARAQALSRISLPKALMSPQCCIRCLVLTPELQPAEVAVPYSLLTEYLAEGGRQPTNTSGGASKFPLTRAENHPPSTAPVLTVFIHLTATTANYLQTPHVAKTSPSVSGMYSYTQKGPGTIHRYDATLGNRPSSVSG